MITLNENLFILNGVLTAMATAAETGEAATAEALPEAKVDAKGKVTIIQPGESNNTDKTAAAKENTQAGKGAATGDTTSAANASSDGTQAASEAAGGAEATTSATGEMTGSAGAGGGTEATGNDAGATDAYTGDMAKEAGIDGADGSDINGVNGGGMDGMNGMDGMGTETGSSFSVTQSVPAMAGITAGVLALAILAGIVLAKLKIKKGINLYED